MIDDFKPVKGYEGLYEVSNLGYVKGLKRNKILAQSTKENGYKQVSLCKNGIIKSALVHIIVAEAFYERQSEHTQVNHKSKDKSNNHFMNLEFCDAFYNQDYSNATNYSFMSPEGVIHSGRNMKRFAEGLNLDYRAFSKLRNGAVKSYKGWTLIS
jgi:hypothetical protein